MSSAVSSLPHAAARDAAQQPDRVRVARVAEDLLRRAPPRRGGRRRARRRARTSSRSTARLWLMKRTLVPNSWRSAAMRSSTSASTVASRPVVGSSRIEQRRVLRERHRDDDALLHAARELVRVAAHDPRRVGDLHLVQHRLALVAAPRSVSTRRGARTTSASCGPTRIDGFSAEAGVLVDHRERRRLQLAHARAPLMASMSSPFRRIEPLVTSPLRGR